MTSTLWLAAGGKILAFWDQFCNSNRCLDSKISWFFACGASREVNPYPLKNLFLALKGFCQYQNRSDFFAKKIGFFRRFHLRAEWGYQYCRTAVLLKLYISWSRFFYFDLRHFFRSIWDPFWQWNFEKMQERLDSISELSRATNILSPPICRTLSSSRVFFLFLRLEVVFLPIDIQTWARIFSSSAAQGSMCLRLPANQLLFVP